MNTIEKAENQKTQLSLKKIKTAFILNLCIFVLELFATIWMMSGITISGEAGTLSAARLAMFKYFTVDSNVLMGIFALIAAIEQYQILKGKKEDISKYNYILQLAGTVGLTVTMLVTIFFLAPTMAAEYGWFANFKNSNFLFHLLNPILSIVVFLGFEKTEKINFRHTFSGILPLGLYAVYYVIQNIIHVEDGMVNKSYDWYGFFMMGLNSIFIVLPIIILFAYLISFGLWKFNKRK